MTNLPKRTAWIVLFVACGAALLLMFGDAHGEFSITVNGKQVEGAPKLLIGSVGFLVGAAVTLLALGVSALAVAGSGFLVICTLALAALITVTLAVPFLLPMVLPIALVLIVLMLSRRGPRSNRA